MAIQVRVPTVLRNHTDGEKKVEGSGGTITALIDDLESRHPGIKDKLIDEGGSIARYVNVYVNDEDVRYLDGASTTLEDGDTVSLLPAVAGG